MATKLDGEGSFKALVAGPLEKKYFFSGSLIFPWIRNTGYNDYSDNYDHLQHFSFFFCCVENWSINLSGRRGEVVNIFFL